MIGIFDSGFGGLTVLRDYLKKYPNYDYMYLTDQANSPYGSHSRERVSKLVVQNVDFLVKKGCKLIIIACNTASANALREVQKKYRGKPAILGVLVPAVEEALKATRYGNIGVIGTRGTISSGSYEIELRKYEKTLYHPKESKAHKNIRVYQEPCPLLVPLAEEGMLHHPVTRILLKGYLKPLKHAHIDVLILGSSHYPFMEAEIKRRMGKNCKVISSATAAVDAIGPYLEKHTDLERSLSRNGEQIFYTTDSPEKFESFGSKFLGRKIIGKKIEI